MNSFFHPLCTCPPRHSKRSLGLEIASYKPMVEIRTLDAGAPVSSIAYDSSGTQLAAGTPVRGGIKRNGDVKIWRGTQSQPRTLNTSSEVNTIAFNPKGTKLAAGLVNGDVAIWDTMTWKSRTLKQGLVGGWVPVGKGVDSILFNPNGKQLAIGYDDGYLELRNAETLKLEILIDTNKKNREDRNEGTRFWLYVYSMTYSPDGKQLVAGLNNQVRIWDTSTGKEVRTLDTKGENSNSIAFNPTGTRLAAEIGTRIIIWDTATWKETRILDAEHGVTSIAYSPKGDYLAAGLVNGLVKIWDTKSWFVRALEAWSTVWSIAFNPVVENTIAAGLVDGRVDGRVVEWDISNFNKSNV